MEPIDETKHKMLDIWKRFHFDSEDEMDSFSDDVYRDGDGNLSEEDESLSDISPHKLNKASDLNREWQTRRDQFYTIGYRDGLIAGKDASAQEGFIVGFKQSVFVGYEWGIVRGLSSVVACLLDEIKEMLIKSRAERDSFHGLFESVHSLSASDALRLLNQDVNETAKQNITAETSYDEPNYPEQNFDLSLVGKCIGELQMLLSDYPSIDVHFSGYQ